MRPDHPATLYTLGTPFERLLSIDTPVNLLARAGMKCKNLGIGVAGLEGGVSRAPGQPWRNEMKKIPPDTTATRLGH